MPVLDDDESSSTKCNMLCYTVDAHPEFLVHVVVYRCKIAAIILREPTTAACGNKPVKDKTIQVRVLVVSV